MFYREDKKGRSLGSIKKSRRMSADCCGYRPNSIQPAIAPFYIFYSMFGFQRIGDLAWACDRRAKGFPDWRNRCPHPAETVKVC